jgi:hypothetical protein
MEDNIRSGENLVVFRVQHADGSEQRSVSRNLRTANGATWQANQLAGSPTTIIRHIGLSSTSTTPASTDTNLLDELAADGLSRTTGTLTYTAGASRYTLSATWVYSGSGVTVKKAGISALITDADTSADTLFVNTLLSPVAVLGSGDTVSLDWGIAF